MYFNWSEIKNTIYTYTSKVFSENNISYSKEEILEAICIFKNFITSTCPYAFLDGLKKEIIPSLQTACVDKVGDIVSLKILLSNTEVFLKRILIATSKATYSEVNDKNKNFMWLYKKSNVSPSFSKNNYTIDESTLNSFLGNQECLYAFALTYLSRNQQIHNSNDWDASEVTMRLKYCLSLYIYITIKNKNELLKHDPSLNKENYTETFSPNENRALYSYFSFGQTSITAKNEIVNSFILYTLYKDGECSLDNIKVKLNKFTQSTILQASFKRLIENLSNKGIITLKPISKTIELTDSQKKRIEEQENNYNENATLFNESIDEVLKKYSLEIHKSDLIDKLRTFFENNYNIDIQEGCELDSNITSNSVFQELYTYIKGISTDGSCIEDILKDIFEVCKTNDFLVRISAGKVFSKISNPEQFSNYVANTNRTIYLDTQIVLFMLCINDEYPAYDNVYYRIAKNLCELSQNNNGITLILADHYLGEIVSHIKQALLLIPFTEITEFQKYKLSNNVFYSYYYYLDKHYLLPTNTLSFADFIEHLFQLYEEDALENSFYQIAQGALVEIFNLLNIKIENIPHYTEDEITNSSKVFQSIISTNMLEEKKDKVLRNDAIMGCHLFNKQYHDDKEPFFLTYDKSFSYFRKTFIETYRRSRGNNLHWYLFTPGKFLNHIDFISMRINIESLTDDMLSIMDNNKFKQKTKTIVDTISKLIDIKNISKESRRDYIEITKLIFTNEEFPSLVEPLNQDQDLHTKRFTEIVDLILNHYRDKGSNHIDSLKSALREKNKFKQLIDIIKKSCNKPEITNTIIISQVDDVITEYFQDNQKKIEEIG